MTAIGQARTDVMAADGGCMAPVLDPDAGPCRDYMGEAREARMTDPRGLEVDRIRDFPAMGKAPSHEDRTRMVALCPGHHRGVGSQAGHQWATSHRADLRAYIAARNERLGWRTA